MYTGATNDVRARFLKHLRGKGAMFTRLNPPLRLAAAMPVGTKAQALRLEYSLKQECRAEKLAWAFRWSWQDVDP